MMKSSQLARESFWGSIVTYAGAAIGFATTFFVLTTFLTKEEVGFTRVLVELATLLSGFGVLGLSTSISRYFPYFRTDRHEPNTIPHRGFLFWILAITTIGLIAISITYGISAKTFNALIGKNSQLLAIYSWSVLSLTAILAYWTVIELYTIQLFHVAIPRVIRELGLRLLLLSTYLIYAVGWISFTGLVWCFLGSYLICLLISTCYLSKVTPLSLQRDPHYPTIEVRRSFLSYTTMAILSTAGTTLAGRMDLFTLSFMPSAGLSAGAVFSIGFFIVSIVEIPTRAIIGFATAKIAHLMKEQDYPAVKHLYQQVSRFQLLCSLVVYMMIYASIDSLIALMPNGSEYQESKIVFIILGLSKLIEVTFTACHPIINTSRYYVWSLYYTILCIAIALCANLYLISLWGVAGAASATAITTLAGYTMLQAVVWYRMRIHPYSRKLVACLLLGIGLYALCSILPEMHTGILAIITRSGITGLAAVIGILVLRLAPEAELFIKQQLAQLWKRVK